MELKLYDTLTREKRAFSPLDPANVRMYVCGPTVYDFAHIGNARPVIVFDVLFRLLRHLYGPEHVTYVRNITDVDDKINARAVRDFPGLPLNVAIRKVTEKTEQQFHADADALGCLRPTFEPRATDFVLPRADGKADMKSLIQKLLDQRNAYVAIGAEGKEVLFDVASMQDYGALSGRRLEEQRAGARIAVDAHKRNAGDFVLWKESGSREPGWNGEFEFVPNPSGGYAGEFIMSSENASELERNSRVITIHGRPGWHIECSAMSAAYLGKVFDIHGGGLDLIFPHHENEIAQSRCAHGTHAMANYWMHNGFLQVEGEKMSKSVGNFFTVRDLLKDWPGEVLRLNMLRTQYRQPIDWTVEGLAECLKILDRWYHSIGEEYSDVHPDEGVLDALADDLNTPLAITRLHAIYAHTRGPDHPLKKIESKRLLVSSARALGLMCHSKHDWFMVERNLVHSSARSNEIDHNEVEELIRRRAAARKAKNFAESDRIRDELAAMGVVLKDSKDGTTWEIAR